MMEI
jgi:hypothetical protein